CGFSASSSRNGVAAGLASGLASNGGLTQTLALLGTSPAIDAGGSSANGCPATDQRGVPRPQGAACDSGAFEYVPPAVTPTPTASNSGGGASSPAPSSAPSQQVGTLLGSTAATSLSNAGISVTIPPVATDATSAAPQSVPVPLAPLQQGTLVLALSTQLTQTVLNQVLTAPAPVAVSAAINPSQGGVIIAGNVAITFPPAALAGITGALTAPGAAPGARPNVVVSVTQARNVPVPGGPAQFSPNGTVLEISITNATTGVPITTFPAPVPITFKYNAADLGQANGNPTLLTAAYVIDANSPPLENPLHFPVGTFVVFPPSATTLDTATGTIVVNTQAIGSTLSVVTNPVGYVQTTTPSAPELSSFANNAQTFGSKPQFSYLQVVEPQIGSRLLVLDPATGNYTYVNASDVGPSGPPPNVSSTAVVRGLLASF
ncbi:MAG TPA: choice-of-anchor Q domain-containing protein, partial [Chloroflexota bacterium]|nr:choice-of-anchor Q domain-containing protein [Chloroflexota bacterium]